GGGTGDPGTVEVGAVGRAEVLSEPLAVPRYETGVPGGRVVVGDHVGGVLGPADRDRLLAERDLGAGELTGGDHQVVGRPALLDSGRVDERTGAGRGDQAAGAGAHEHVPADHAYHREHEDPQ